MSSIQQGWIGFDLDGTLTVWPCDFPGIGAPVMAMVARVQAYLAVGYEVRIFTARVAESGRVNTEGMPDNAAFVADQRARIEAWSEEVIGQKLRVTSQKDFEMLVLFDDRAVQVESNTGRLLTPRQTLNGLAL